MGIQTSNWDCSFYFACRICCFVTIFKTYFLLKLLLRNFWISFTSIKISPSPPKALFLKTIKEPLLLLLLLTWLLPLNTLLLNIIGSENTLEKTLRLNTLKLINKSWIYSPRDSKDLNFSIFENYYVDGNLLQQFYNDFSLERECGEIVVIWSSFQVMRICSSIQWSKRCNSIHGLQIFLSRMDINI